MATDLSAPVTAPTRVDPFARDASTIVGGPVGKHTRFGGAFFWTPLRVVVAVTMMTFTLGFAMKLPCSGHSWVHNYQYTRLCYSDVYALYFSEGINEHKVPYVDHDVEYPVVIGGLMWLAGEASDNASDFYAVTAGILLACAVAAAVLTGRTAGRRRPWDAMLFALAPGLLLHGTTNWDLAAVALAAAALYAWSRRQPEMAGIWLGLAIATKLYPVLFLAGLFFLCLRARRLGDFFRAAFVTGATVLLVYAPIVLASGTFTFDGCDGKVRQAAWLKFFTLNRCRGADWDSLAFAWSKISGHTIEVSRLNMLTGLLTVVVVVAVGTITLVAPRRPRLPQVLFLLVAGFLVVNKVNSPQYTLWLIPLAALARPRWGAFLAWQGAEILVLFTRFYYFVNYAEPQHGIEVQWFVAAVLLRDGLLLLLCALVVWEIFAPYRDAVRRDGEDDPAGGSLDGALDWGERAHGSHAPALA